MKICGISDMHGFYNFSVDKCDVLCVAGDIVPLNFQYYETLCFEWLERTFIPWCNKQPVDKVIVIAGNHDLFAEKNANKIKNIFEGTKIVYLCDDEYVYNGVKFYGTPWCHQFGHWAFMDSDDILAEYFGKMTNDIDVLIAHDSPYGVSDLLLQKGYEDRGHIGSIPLANIINEKQPKVMLHGHLHSTNHKKELLGNTKVYCVSLLDERYEYKYKPLYLKI